MENVSESTTETVILITWSPKTNTTAKNVNTLIQKHCDLFFYQLIAFANDFEINPELNVSGNIHYHGFIAWSEEYKYEYNRFILALKGNGFMKVNKVKHSLSKAMEYCRKDRHALNGMIKNKYLPISLHNQDSWCKFNIKLMTTIAEEVMKNKDTICQDEEADDPLEYGISRLKSKIIKQVSICNNEEDSE